MRERVRSRKEAARGRQARRDGKKEKIETEWARIETEAEVKTGKDRDRGVGLKGLPPFASAYALQT